MVYLSGRGPVNGLKLIDLHVHLTVQSGHCRHPLFLNHRGIGFDRCLSGVKVLRQGVSVLMDHLSTFIVRVVWVGPLRIVIDVRRQGPDMLAAVAIF